MKMTIVIDSDDINGIEDAYKMTRLMYTKYVRAAPSSYSTLSFGKIEFIKAIRKFGRDAIDNYQNDEDFDLTSIHSLRFCKTFADHIWREKQS
jgi:hypothetical protein